MKRLSFLIAVVLIAALLLSGVTHEGKENSLRGYWAKVYTGDHVRGGASSLVKSDDGTYLVGWVNISNSKKGLVVRLSEDGNVSRAVAYGVEGLECIFEGGIATGKSIIVAGVLFNETSIENKLLIAGIDQDMRPLWAETFNLSVSLIVRAVKTTDDGILVAGLMMSREKVGPFVMKLNHRGEVLWAKRYTNASNEFLGPAEITSDGEGGFLLLGLDLEHGFSQMSLIDIDGNGNVKWAKIYTSQEDVYGSVILTDGKRIVVAGEVGNILAEGSTSDVFVAVFDERGNVSWAKTYGGDGIDSAGAAEFIDGSIVVAGIYGGKLVPRIPITIENYSMWILNLDGEGKVLWEKAYWAGIPSFLIQDGDSILVGGTFLSGNESKPFLSRIRWNGSAPDMGITPSYHVREIHLKAEELGLKVETLKVKVLPVKLELQNIPLEAEPIEIER